MSTFIVYLTVAVDICLSYHLINLCICQSLTEVVHHLYNVIAIKTPEAADMALNGTP